MSKSSQSLHAVTRRAGFTPNVKYFHLTRKMYEEKQMLGQHGDMSGAWTPEQKEIIRKQGLKQK